MSTFKKMTGRILPLLLLAAVLLGGFRARAAEFKNEETGYRAVIEDDAELLSEGEERLLMEKMKPVTAYGNAMFKSVSKNSMSAAGFAESCYASTFGSSANGVLFLIDMDNREIYLCSAGALRRTITNDKADSITDNIYRKASSKMYYSCAEGCFDQVATLLEGGRIAEPMRYIDNALLAVILALLINFVVVTFVTRTRRAGDAQLLQVVTAKIEGEEPVGRETNTTKVYSPVQSSGGGRSGGGGGFSGGGGGGFSGGGHKF